MSTFPPPQPTEPTELTELTEADQFGRRHSEKDTTMTNDSPFPSDPLAPDDPTRAFDPTVTSQLPHLPQASAPYRVEPSTPVPDDRVAPEPPQPTSLPTSMPTWQPQPQPREQAENHRPLVTVAKGPRPGTVLFGLISIVVAAYVIIDNLGGSNLDLRQNLPAALGAVGALLLLVGLVGVVTSRRRR